MTTPSQTATIPALSREYIYVPVTVFGDDDPTELPVHMAFLPERSDRPVDADWAIADWDPTAITPTIRCLVGTGGTIELTPESYWVWVRITGAVERPVRQTGQLKVT